MSIVVVKTEYAGMDVGEIVTASVRVFGPFETEAAAWAWAGTDGDTLGEVGEAAAANQQHCLQVMDADGCIVCEYHVGSVELPTLPTVTEAVS